MSGVSEQSPNPETTGASGVGLATVTTDGTVLDTWYPHPKLIENDTAGTNGTERLTEDEAKELLGEAAAALLGPDTDRGVEVVAVRTTIGKLADAPADTHDIYLRLHLLSHRLVRPHGQNLDGMFGLLANVVWTNHGPCPVEGFETTRLRLRSRGAVTVYSVDKFPRMVDYVLPSGVRIGDADRVRLGAHLASGTTVMHEGFVNFNAGTLGASIMGTLSGGGKETISLGERCLIGANGGVGISLGDDSVIEAGLYVTAGTKVVVEGKVVKARELNGVSGAVFRRNSATGAVEVVPRTGSGVELNAALHAND